MGHKEFDGYSGLIISGFLALTLVFLQVSGVFSTPSSSGFVILSEYFWFDTTSFYLSFLSILLWISLLFFLGRLSLLSIVMITVSVLASILSYCCVHAFFFWFFYEMSILSLLFLLVMESPYSERYVASWYLMGYVVVTSLPMLLCLFYFSFAEGSFILYNWCLEEGFGVWLSVLLAILFITKIPLFPFHVWLPIVHAEASSAVSVCLSGYVMKLGVLGGFRFCSYVLPDFVFSFLYCLFVLFFSILFFFSASRELDGKRWLAFLSLAHILIPVVCLGAGLFDYSGVSFLYCLGHGLSAGVTFILLWILYDVSGSRNWLLLKNGVSNSVLFRLCCVACLCTVASLPPMLQFFSEVFVVCVAGVSSGLLVLAMSFYLFLGGLVPTFLVGGLLTRHYSIGFGCGLVFSGVCSVLFLVFWSFVLFLLC
nr:NADH dehydrogenase subunit 4 [Glypthelmins quieta]